MTMFVAWPGLPGRPAASAEGVRGGRVRLQAPHRGAGTHPPGRARGHDIREQVRILPSLSLAY